jgi:hypothetical protein
MASQNFTNNGDFFRFAIAGASSSTTTNFVDGVAGMDGTGTYMEPGCKVGPTTTKQYLAGGFGGIHTLLIETPGLDTAETAIFSGGNPWPTEASGIQLVARADAGTFQFMDPSSSTLPLTSYGLLMFPAASGSTTLTVEISRIRVDYKL